MPRGGKSKRVILVIVAVFSLLGLGALLPADSVQADNENGPFVSEKIRNQVVDKMQLTYTLQCNPTSLPAGPNPEFGADTGNGFYGFASTPQLSKQKILDQSILGAVTSRGAMFPNEILQCDGGQEYGFAWAFENFGRGNLVDFYCSLPSVFHSESGGKGKTVNGGSDKAACKAGVSLSSGVYTAPSGTNLRQQVKDEFAKSGNRAKAATQPMDQKQQYIQYWLSFEKSCKTTLTSEYPKNGDPAAGNNKIYKISVVNQNGTVVNYIGNSDGKGTKDTKIYLDASRATPDMTCGDLADGMARFATAYSTYMKGPGKDDKGVAGTGIDEDKLGTDAAAGDDEIETTCGIDGVGWIVCPIANFMAELNDAAFGFLQTLLEIRPALITDPATSKAWSTFRDLANVAFIIAFLFIVYSQVTGVGVSNYGIKKLLPRIFVAAVLVNLSYIICALAVDLSNIVGSSIYNLLGTSIPVGVNGETNGDLADGWQKSVGPILAAGAAAIVLLVVILPVLPVVLLALAVILFILIARQAFVIILVVMAPLAFVAYLLPNTENWFKKWRQAFVAVLMVYPIVGVIFGASMLASKILMGVANGTEGEGNDEQLLKIVALAVLAVPLFAVPVVLKGSLAAAGSIGAKLSSLADRTNRMASSRTGDRMKDLNNKRKIAALNGSGFGSRVAGGFGLTRRNVRRDFLRSSRDSEAKRAQGNYMNEALGEMNQNGEYTSKASRLQNAAAGGGRLRQADASAQVRAAAMATQGLHKQYNDDVSAFKATMSSKSNEELVSMVSDASLSSEQAAAAAGLVMSRGHRESHLQAIDAVGKRMQRAESSNDTKEMELASDIQKQMAHDMRDKPWALGDQAVGQLTTGDYGKTFESKDAAGNTVKKRYGDIQAELQDRVGTKLSAASLADMNPDEMKRIHKAAMNGDLTSDQLATLKKSILEARSNQQVEARIKPEAKALHEEILGSTTSTNRSANTPSAVEEAQAYDSQLGSRVANNAEAHDEASTYNDLRDRHVDDITQAQQEAIDINLRR